MQISALLAQLQSPKASERFNAAKQCLALSASDPRALYPAWHLFVGLLRGSNQILQWNAIRILCNLASVDTERHVDEILEEMLDRIPGPSLITASNVMASMPAVARARPDLADRIMKGILAVRRAKYKTPECRRVASGHAVSSLVEMFPLLRNPEPVLAFLREQAKSTRPAVRKLANRTLAELEQDAVLHK